MSQVTWKRDGYFLYETMLSYFSRATDLKYIRANIYITTLLCRSECAIFYLRAWIFVRTCVCVLAPVSTWECWCFIKSGEKNKSSDCYFDLLSTNYVSTLVSDLHFIFYIFMTRVMNLLWYKISTLYCDLQQAKLFCIFSRCIFCLSLEYF